MTQIRAEYPKHLFKKMKKVFFTTERRINMLKTRGWFNENREKIVNALFCILMLVLMVYVSCALYTIKNPAKQPAYQYFISYVSSSDAGISYGNIMTNMPNKKINNQQEMRNIEEAIRQQVPNCKGICILNYRMLGKVKQ